MTKEFFGFILKLKIKLAVIFTSNLELYLNMSEWKRSRKVISLSGGDFGIESEIVFRFGVSEVIQPVRCVRLTLNDWGNLLMIRKNYT